MNPNLSICQAVTVTGLSRKSIREILKLNKFRRDKMKILQELSDNDPAGVIV